MAEPIKLKGEYDKLATQLRKQLHKEFYWAASFCSGQKTSPIEDFLIGLYVKFDDEIMLVENRNTDEQHKMLQEYKDSL